MNSINFYNNIKESKVFFSKQEIDELKNIQEEYPYFQMAKMLALRAMYLAKDNGFKKQMAKTAANVLDREVMFDFVYIDYKNEEKQNLVSQDNTLKITESSVDEKSIEKEKKNNAPEDIKEKELEKNNPSVPKKSILKKTKNQIPVIDRGSSIGIIEKFIKNNPGISKPENKKYAEELNIAGKSIEESFDLVSETMANLYLKQGHYVKAIKIYEKLILIYPEKSAYFAALISELKNNNKTE